MTGLKIILIKHNLGNIPKKEIFNPQNGYEWKYFCECLLEHLDEMRQDLRDRLNYPLGYTTDRELIREMLNE